MNSRLITFYPALLLGTLLLAGNLSAGVTGKISGAVTDIQTGHPIVGASVRIIGTEIGTTTDDDGEYCIINVPSGRYDLAVTSVGFEALTKREVRVLLDLTTPVDFEIKEVAIELKQEMVVYASNPIVQKDLTASRIIYTADRLKNMPNVTSMAAILGHYPGVILDKKDEMHVRGGRAGQISYYYDGFSIQDPFTSNSGMRVVPTALEELSLTSGGFAAEYGEALSGVVNAVTPEGGAIYRGKARFYEGMTHPYDVNSGTWGALKSLGNRAFSVNVSGPVPGMNPERYTFFGAAEVLRDNNSLPHSLKKNFSGTGKLTMRPAKGLKLVTNGAYFRSDGDQYTHRDVNGRSYDFNLDGLSSFERRAYLAGFSGSYSISERTIATLTFNRFLTRSLSAPGFLMNVYWKDWPGYSEDASGSYNGTIHTHNYLNNRDWDNPYQAVGYAQGDDYIPSYQYRQTAYNAVSGSLLKQVTKTHQVKAGFEYRQYQVHWDKKQFYNEKPYGELYSSKPMYGSFYTQDKLEYADFVINMGVRFDYRNADISYNATPADTAVVYAKAESKSRWSPRLGVSFPISERSVMHFNYGLYYQIPQYNYMYTNLQGDIRTGYPLLGNPNLAPEQTVSYELGLDQLVTDKLRLDLTAYYKDVSDLTTTRESMKFLGRTVTRFDNGDYGHVKGLDMTLDRLAVGGNFSASLAYSYMTATGVGSTALDPYYSFLTSTEDTLAPVKEYPLDFDQRHTVTAMIDYRVPANWAGSLFGIKLPGAWGFNFVGYYGSGLPYTKTDSLGNRRGERNEGRLPSNYSVDMRFNKDFSLGFKGYPVTFFVEVDNLFDRKNVLNVYTRTGLADNDAQQPGASLSLNASEVGRLDRLYDHDPQNYSAPRTVRTGLEINF